MRDLNTKIVESNGDLSRSVPKFHNWGLKRVNEKGECNFCKKGWRESLKVVDSPDSPDGETIVTVDVVFSVERMVQMGRACLKYFQWKYGFIPDKSVYMTGR